MEGRNAEKGKEQTTPRLTISNTSFCSSLSSNSISFANPSPSADPVAGATGILSFDRKREAIVVEDSGSVSDRSSHADEGAADEVEKEEAEEEDRVEEEEAAEDKEASGGRDWVRLMTLRKD